MSVCYYGPGGRCETFPDGTPCPDGWADHPAKVKEHPLVEAAREFAKFDGDGDGKPGGSKPRRKVTRRDPRK